MKRFNPDMEVVRFGAEDIIVTSGAADMVFDSTMGDGIKANGTVTFHGVPYPMSSLYDMGFISDEIEQKYGKDVDDLFIGEDHETLYDVFRTEITDGLGQDWVGSYTYDANSRTFIKLKQ